VAQLNSRVEQKLSQRESDFMQAFTEKMRMLGVELNELRRQLEEKQLRIRANERMYVLEEERDYFRNQVVALNQENRQLAQENKALRTRLRDQQGELERNEGLLLGLKKGQLSLKQELVSLYR
jgi:chromosome segregation ATPase